MNAKTVPLIRFVTGETFNNIAEKQLTGSNFGGRLSVGWVDLECLHMCLAAFPNPINSAGAIETWVFCVFGFCLCLWYMFMEWYPEQDDKKRRRPVLHALAIALGGSAFVIAVQTLAGIGDAKLNTDGFIASVGRTITPVNYIFLICAFIATFVITVMVIAPFLMCYAKRAVSSFHVPKGSILEWTLEVPMKGPWGFIHSVRAAREAHFRAQAEKLRQLAEAKFLFVALCWKLDQTALEEARGAPIKTAGDVNKLLNYHLSKYCKLVTDTLGKAMPPIRLVAYRMSGQKQGVMRLLYSSATPAFRDPKDSVPTASSLIGKCAKTRTRRAVLGIKKDKGMVDVDKGVLRVCGPMPIPPDPRTRLSDSGEQSGDTVPDERPWGVVAFDVQCASSGEGSPASHEVFVEDLSNVLGFLADRINTLREGLMTLGGGLLDTDAEKRTDSAESTPSDQNSFPD